MTIVDQHLTNPNTIDEVERMVGEGFVTQDNVTSD